MDVTSFSDPILRHVFSELTIQYQCHTVILYGSRARGDFTPDSDYDAAALASPTDLPALEKLVAHFLKEIPEKTHVQ